MAPQYTGINHLAMALFPMTRFIPERDGSSKRVAGIVFRSGFAFGT